MQWHFQSDQPIYLQIIDHLKAAIICGIYPPGSRLPSIRDLSMEAGVNPNTLQRALSVLESEKLLETQRTTGKTVTSDAARIAQLRMSYSDDILAACISKLKSLGFSEAEIAESFESHIHSHNVLGKEPNHE